MNASKENKEKLSMKLVPTKHIALCIKSACEKKCLDLRTLVTIEARLALEREMMHIPLGHLAVGALPVTGLLSVEAARGVMDAAGASCSYMMEGDFQLCWHQLSRSHRGVTVVYSAAMLSPPWGSCCSKHYTETLINKFYGQEYTEWLIPLSHQNKDQEENRFSVGVNGFSDPGRWHGSWPGFYKDYYGNRMIAI